MSPSLEVACDEATQTSAQRSPSHPQRHELRPCTADVVATQHTVALRRDVTRDDAKGRKDSLCVPTLLLTFPLDELQSDSLNFLWVLLRWFA